MVFTLFFFLFNLADYARSFLRKQEWRARSVTVNNVLMHFQRSKVDKVEKGVHKEGEVLHEVSVRSEMGKNGKKGSKHTKHVSDAEVTTDSNRRLEHAWLTKALEPASQLYRWALSSGLFMLVGFLISLVGNLYLFNLIITCFQEKMYRFNILLLNKHNLLFCNFLLMHFCLFKAGGGLYYLQIVFAFLMVFLKFQDVSKL